HGELGEIGVVAPEHHLLDRRLGVVDVHDGWWSAQSAQDLRQKLLRGDAEGPGQPLTAAVDPADELGLLRPDPAQPDRLRVVLEDVGDAGEMDGLVDNLQVIGVDQGFDKGAQPKLVNVHAPTIEDLPMAPDVSPRRAWAGLIVLSLTAFAFITTELLPIGVLTLIAPDLDRSRSQVGLLVSGYAVVVVLASIPLTRLTQQVPRRALLGVTMVVFAAANAVAALASTYAVLAGARLVTALAQALFWSVASAAVTGPFPVAVRGRIVALFSTGAPLAPALGQQAGWRAAFAVLAAVGLAIAFAVLLLIPSYPPAAGGAARGTAPDRRRFALLLAATALGVGGFLTLNTYVTPFVLDVSGFSTGALAPLLFASGAAGVVGTIIAARTLDTRPIASLF